MDLKLEDDLDEQINDPAGQSSDFFILAVNFIRDPAGVKAVSDHGLLFKHSFTISIYSGKELRTSNAGAVCFVGETGFPAENLEGCLKPY
jgi:hypothetical protein